MTTDHSAPATREQRNTIVFGGLPRRKCAVVACQEPSSRAFRSGIGDATSVVVYEFCHGHGAAFSKSSFSYGEVEPTWDFPPGNWLHDGTPLDPKKGINTP